MELISAVESAMDTVAGIVASALGGIDVLLQCLMGLMVLDVVAGCGVALYLRKSNKTKSGGFSWTVFRKGIVQKLMMLVIVVVANILDLALGVELLRQIVCLFYIAEEGMSVLENAERLGLPLPAKLRQVLEIIDEETGTEKFDDETVEAIKDKTK